MTDQTTGQRRSDGVTTWLAKRDEWLRKVHELSDADLSETCDYFGKCAALHAERRELLDATQDDDSIFGLADPLSRQYAALEKYEIFADILDELGRLDDENKNYATDSIAEAMFARHNWRVYRWTRRPTDPPPVLINEEYERRASRLTDLCQELHELCRQSAGRNKVDRADRGLATDGATNREQSLSRGKKQLVDVIREAGQRLTQKQILERLSMKGVTPGEGTAKAYLAELMNLGILTNDRKAKPRGYGLPEWDS